MSIGRNTASGGAAAASCSSRRGPKTVPASSQTPVTVTSGNSTEASRIAVRRAKKSPSDAAS